MSILENVLNRLEKFVVLEKEVEHLARSTSKLLDTIESHEKRLTKIESKFEVYESLGRKKIE
jgi:flagellar biosynthesis chaperone FliJ